MFELVYIIYKLKWYIHHILSLIFYLNSLPLSTILLRDPDRAGVERHDTKEKK